jgi:serine phosphatase RsbU (regulator of sigma subunit)
VKKKVQLQVTLLEEKSKEMSDSINYAKRIQLATLPKFDAIQAHFNQSFVLFEPKDVVASDFFWMEEYNGLIYFAVADCTGHGVPGAMMSVLCHGALDKAMKESNIPSPAEVLTLTRKYVISQIATGEGHLINGMDVALCAFNKITGELQFSGAQNPLWIASKRLIAHPNVLVNKLEFGLGYLHEIKGDKKPVGEFFASSSFTNHSIFLAEGDTIYIFSDGFPDQCGGRKGKKLENSLFKELIGLVQDQDDLGKQKDFLSEYFINWKGDLEQVDDVCVMGIKL